MENYRSLAGSEFRALVHRRSATSDSQSTFKHYLIKPGVGDNFALGEVESSSIGNDDTICHFNCNNEVSENSSSQSDKKPSSGDEVTLFTDSSTKTKLKNWSPNYVPGMDPKKTKRMLANRESSQRSRLRKSVYIDKLKRDIDTEEARLSMMSPQVAYHETRCKLLELKNNELIKEMEGLENEKASKEAEFQVLMEELEALDVAYMLRKRENKSNIYLDFQTLEKSKSLYQIKLNESSKIC